jgi:preprotein translocase SecE subunit
MAITVKQNNVSDAIETANNSLNIENPNIKQATEKEFPKSELPKKQGFLSSTISELKKVEWPSIPYISRWILVIIVFTASLAIGLGVIDNFFQSTITLAQCNGKIVTQTTADTTGDCFNKFKDDLLFKQKS